MKKKRQYRQFPVSSPTVKTNYECKIEYDMPNKYASLNSVYPAIIFCSLIACLACTTLADVVVQLVQAYVNGPKLQLNDTLDLLLGAGQTPKGHITFIPRRRIYLYIYVT